MQLQKFIDQALPVISQKGVTYNKANNIFLTDGYTSAAGNVYFQGIRLSDRIVIKENIGQGYAYTFLNGIQIFGFNGKDLQLLCSSDYHCLIYDKADVKEKTLGMIKAYLKDQLKLTGVSAADSTLTEFSNALIESVYSNMKQIQA